MMAFLIMSGWDRHQVYFEMTVQEIQASMIYASRQRLREMQYATAAVSAGVGMLFEKKGQKGGGFLEKLSKDIAKLGEGIDTPQLSAVAKKRAAQANAEKFSERLIAGFSKMMGKQPITLRKGDCRQAAIDRSPGIKLIKGPPPGIFD